MAFSEKRNHQQPCLTLLEATFPSKVTLQKKVKLNV